MDLPIDMKYLTIFIIILLLSCTTEDMGGKQSGADENHLLDQLQKSTIDYFWVGGEPSSGAARERYHVDEEYQAHDKDIVTTGGTGFGIMALIVGIERNFICKKEGLERMHRLVNFLKKSDRFHGAWPHWLNHDGEVVPFSHYDNGADLVETAFLAQGLLTFRQYLEKNKWDDALKNSIDKLWREIDWAFFTRGEQILYWHWSPEHEWRMNFKVKGYNECLIMYILGTSSPTYPIEASVFHEGYMRSGAIKSSESMYGIPLHLDHYPGDVKKVGPLFWAHYSYLGLDPRKLEDKYTNYWDLNVNHAKIHHKHSVINRYKYKNYSDSCWGLTSSYSMMGYSGHNPQEDSGVISPTAALSSFPYTPEESMKFLKYLNTRPDLIGPFGPYDAFSDQSQWYVKKYLAIDQLPIPIMVENYRTGLIWDLFMSAPEIQTGLAKLGISNNKISTK